MFSRMFWNYKLLLVGLKDTFNMTGVLKCIIANRHLHKFYECFMVFYDKFNIVCWKFCAGISVHMNHCLLYLMVKNNGCFSQWIYCIILDYDMNNTLLWITPCYDGITPVMIKIYWDLWSYVIMMSSPMYGIKAQDMALLLQYLRWYQRFHI